MIKILIYFACGIAGGILGGMGMGGGTLLIPLLTILAGVEQKVAQGVNLVCFIPTSIVALCMHVRNGLVDKSKILPICLPAVISSVSLCYVAKKVKGKILKILFGTFLILLAVYTFYKAVKGEKNQKTQRKKKVKGKIA